MQKEECSILKNLKRSVIRSEVLKSRSLSKRIKKKSNFSNRTSFIENNE